MKRGRANIIDTASMFVYFSSKKYRYPDYQNRTFLLTVCPSLVFATFMKMPSDGFSTRTP